MVFHDYVNGHKCRYRREFVLRALNLFVGDEVDVVDAMGWPDDVPMNASYIHKRFEYFDNSLSEVKEDIKGVRDAIDVLASSVKSSQKSIGEAIAILLNKISNSNPDVIIE